MTSRPWIWLLSGGLGILIAPGLVQFVRRPMLRTDAAVIASVQPVESVAALGQLEPAGDVRHLAAPSSGFGGTPRIARLFVQEGSKIKRGQVLAEFDNRPKILADIAAIDARLSSLNRQIAIKRREISRYDRAATIGAAAMVTLEVKQDGLVQLEGRRRETIADRIGLSADLADSQLLSPIDGLVLRLHSREGERPGPDGVLEVGASQAMQAAIEVYESDISRIRPDQVVVLTSENGGFTGTLRGRVMRISPQVRQRRVFFTDPTGDADARVVGVRVELDANSAARVSSLAGMKVIARFQA